jgi:hypothetical protein
MRTVRLGNGGSQAGPMEVGRAMRGDLVESESEGDSLVVRSSAPQG